jgi:sucrose phosphorylase
MRGFTVHLLPFYPNSGDGGFAPDNWFEVDPSMGTINDLKLFIDLHRTMIDGIYNHVGVNHKWWRLAQSDLAYTHRFLTYISRPDARSGVRSHRSTELFRPWHIAGEVRWAWQTFGNRSVDLNLRHEAVREAIIRHLHWAEIFGVVAIRLDAVAFYGKEIGVESIHLPFAYDFARWIARTCKENRLDLELVGQVDIDQVGIGYLANSKRVGLHFGYDYSFPALICELILTGNGERLCAHLVRTGRIGESSVRAVRTHDGIYLRSPLLGNESFNELIRQAEMSGLNISRVDGAPYEINSSFPFICRTAANNEEAVASNLSFSSALIAQFCSTRPYVYLPAILEFIPEDIVKFDANNPRDLNRIPIPLQHIAFKSRSERFRSGVELIQLVENLLDKERNPELSATWEKEYRLLSLRRGCYRLCFNASSDQSVHERLIRGSFERIIGHIGGAGGVLEPGGSYVLTTYA